MCIHQALPSIHLNVITLNSTNKSPWTHHLDCLQTQTCNQTYHYKKTKKQIVRVGFETSNVHIVGGITRGRCKYTTWNSKLLKRFGGSYYSHHYSDCPPEDMLGGPGAGGPINEGWHSIQWMNVHSVYGGWIWRRGRAFIEAAPNPCVPRCKMSIFFQFKNNRY